jgi:hypothetical protein
MATDLLSKFKQNVLMSNALCDFLELPHGSTLSRPEIHQLIFDYIRSKNLRNSSNLRHFILDDKLKTIFAPLLSHHESYSYLNTAFYIKHNLTTLPTPDSISKTISDSTPVFESFGYFGVKNIENLMEFAEFNPTIRIFKVLNHDLLLNLAELAGFLYVEFYKSFPSYPSEEIVDGILSLRAFSNFQKKLLWDAEFT